VHPPEARDSDRSTGHLYEWQRFSSKWLPVPSLQPTCFAETFQFKDWGIGLEFRNIRRLADFFKKTCELYPDSSLQTDNVLLNGDHVITQ